MQSISSVMQVAHFLFSYLKRPFFHQVNQMVTDPPALMLWRSHLHSYQTGTFSFTSLTSKVISLECSRVLLTITCTKPDILNVFPISPLGEQQSKPPPEGGLQPPCPSSQFLQLLRMRSHTTKRKKNICGERGSQFLPEFLYFFSSHLFTHRKWQNPTKLFEISL